MDSKHTIVLVQYTIEHATRTYMDYETVPLAMDGVCQIFEKRLKELNPTLQNITYDITDLYTFVDQLTDLSALVFNPAINAYTPHDKEWIKKRAFAHLKRQVQ